MKKSEIKKILDSLHLSDVYSLMLFILYRIEDIPDYATLSRLCFLLDGSNLTRLLTYYGGKTVTFPTYDQFKLLINALLLYQYVNLEGYTLPDAQKKLDVPDNLQQPILDLYLKIIPIISEYNLDKEQLDIYEKHRRDN